MSLKILAQELNSLEDELKFPLDSVMHKLVQELGEFNDAIQKYRWIYCKSRLELVDIEKEAGDLFANFISVLNRLGIDPDSLPSFVESSLAKFRERKELYKQAHEL